MDLSIVILNFNSGIHLGSCLEAAVRSSEGLKREFFVIDNASEDGSFDRAMAEFPEGIPVDWIRNSENVGFGRGINPSLRSSRGRWVLLLNPDTRVHADAIRKLLTQADAEGGVGIAGGQLLYPDGRFQWACRRRIPNPKTALARFLGFSKHYNYSEDPNQRMVVEAVSGSYMLVRNQLFREIGFFDETFFMYGEDLDLCFRAGRAGWQILYLPEAVAVHNKGESSRQGSHKALYEFYRAMWIFHRKHYRKSQPWVLNAAVWVGIWGLWFWNFLLYPFRFDKRVGSR